MTIRLLAAMAVLTAILASAPALAQPSDDEAMNRCLTGCRAWWDVYASIPGGRVWWFEDKDGANPQGQAIDAKADVVEAALAKCGIHALVSLSDWFDDFGGDLVVVHSDPHASRAAAEAELAKAKACGLTGYVKFSPFQFTGRD
jgi:hypothetical protein